MSTYPAEGEVCDVIIRGARLFALPDPEDEPGERVWTFQLPGAVRERELFSVCLDLPQVTVERVGPADWPPQAGDIWSDEAGDAEEWHALPVRFGSTDVILHLDSALAGLEPAGFIDSFPRARLVRRRGPVTEDREA